MASPHLVLGWGCETSDDDHDALPTHRGEIWKAILGEMAGEMAGEMGKPQEHIYDYWIRVIWSMNFPLTNWTGR